MILKVVISLGIILIFLWLIAVIGILNIIFRLRAQRKELERIEKSVIKLRHGG
jgi:type IV secretory pathway TrbL component